MSSKNVEKKFDYNAIIEMFHNFYRCNRLIWAENKYYLIAIGILFILSSLIPFVRSGLNALLINKFVEIASGTPVDTTVYYLVGLVVLSYSVLPLIVAYESHISRIFYFFLEKKFQLDILIKLANLDIATHEDPSKKDLITKVVDGGIWRLQNFVDRQFYLIQNIVEIIIASSIIAYSEVWILLIIFVGLIPGLINEIKFGRMIWNIWGTESETRRKFSNLTYRFHQVSGLIEMKLFQNIKSFIQIITNLLEKYQNKEIKSEKTRVKLEIFAKLISQITFGIAIIYYSMEVIGYRMDIGTYTFMIASIATFKDAVSGLTITLARQYADNMFVTDTFELLSLQPFIVSPINAIPIDSKKIYIEFKNISFKYPGTEKFVLKNFNLRINHGDKIAIIGVNGAGKTTLIKLLCRFYDPTEGEILINGINLKNINLENWYSKLGALFQDFERYYFTTKQLISLGDTEKLFKMSRIKSSAKLSGAHDFINEWPNKYDQMMGKNFSEGVEPSVGQWQKLALARTYYRDPKIMILDEPTASIDAEAEAKIFNELNRTTKNKTVILISHRFSTVRNADKICVIKDGKLAEYGSHKQLIKLNKTYARLFNLQAKGYK